MGKFWLTVIFTAVGTMASGARAESPLADNLKWGRIAISRSIPIERGAREVSFQEGALKLRKADATKATCKLTMVEVQDRYREIDPARRAKDYASYPFRRVRFTSYPGDRRQMRAREKREKQNKGRQSLYVGEVVWNDKTRELDLSFDEDPTVRSMKCTFPEGVEPTVDELAKILGPTFEVQLNTDSARGNEAPTPRAHHM